MALCGFGSAHTPSTTGRSTDFKRSHAYPLLYRRRGHGAVAMFVDNVDGALSVLNNAGHRVITENDLLDDDEYL